MINDLLSPATASTSPFANSKGDPDDDALRFLAAEIVRLTPTLAETLVRASKQGSLTQPIGTAEQKPSDR